MLKNPKETPGAPVRFPFGFSGTVEDNIRRFEVFLIFVRLKRGADLCRFRFVYSLFSIISIDKKISLKSLISKEVQQALCFIVIYCH